MAASAGHARIDPDPRSGTSSNALASNGPSGRALRVVRQIGRIPKAHGPGNPGTGPDPLLSNQARSGQLGRPALPALNIKQEQSQQPRMALPSGPDSFRRTGTLCAFIFFVSSDRGAGRGFGIPSGMPARHDRDPRRAVPQAVAGSPEARTRCPFSAGPGTAGHARAAPRQVTRRAPFDTRRPRPGTPHRACRPSTAVCAAFRDRHACRQKREPPPCRQDPVSTDAPAQDLRPADIPHFRWRRFADPIPRWVSGTRLLAAKCRQTHARDDQAITTPGPMHAVGSHATNRA